MILGARRYSGLHLLLLGIVVLGSMVRFQNAMRYSPMQALWSDPYRHWKHAINSLDTTPAAFMDTPLYQFWLAAVAKLTLGDSRTVGLYSAVLSILATYAWYRFLRELLPSKTTALLGWGILTWLPSWIGIYSYFMNETIALPLLGLSLWMTWRARRKKTTEAFVWNAVAWLLAGLVRGIVIPLAMIATAYLWMTQGEKRRRFCLLVTILATALVPLGLRSYMGMRVVAPHGMKELQEINFASGKAWLDLYFVDERKTNFQSRFLCASPSMFIQPLHPLSDWRTSRTGTTTVTVAMNKGWEDWEAAAREIHLPFAMQLRYIAENVIFTLFAQSWPDQNPHRFWEAAAVASRWIWAPLFVANVVGFCWLARRKRIGFLLPVLTIVGFLMLMFLPFTVSEGRYRKPLEGLLIANALSLVTHAREKNTVPKESGQVPL